MAITEPMVLLRMEDVAVYAEARQLVRAVKGFAPAPGGDRRGLEELAFAAVAVAATVAEALRGWSDQEEIRCLRDAAASVADVRAEAWRAYRAGALAPRDFDEVMAACARCRREIDDAEAAARHRARRRIDGVGRTG